MKPFYRLKITLANSSPAIWREFIVPKNISLDRLHDVIQIVMGWDDYHQHEFVFGKKCFTEFPGEVDTLKPSGREVLSKYAKKKGDTFTYIYDWGDDWEHVLVLEDPKVDSATLSRALICTKGANACPPEDVGGILGYKDFCKAMAKPKLAKNKELVEWYGMPFNPKEFDMAEINLELNKYWRWSRNRELPWDL